MTIKELLRNNKQINTLIIIADVYVRGITKQIIVGTLNVIRAKDNKYMSLEKLQDIDVTENDNVLQWSIILSSELEVKVHGDY